MGFRAYLSSFRQKLHVAAFLFFTTNAVQVLFLWGIVTFALLAAVLKNCQQPEYLTSFGSYFHVVRLAAVVICWIINFVY